MSNGNAHASNGSSHSESLSGEKLDQPCPQRTSYPKHKIKILLLENIHPVAAKLLQEQSFQVECISTSLSEASLKEKVKDVHCIGIRSATQLTAEILNEAKRLLAIGCFCIGTNQVDLDASESKGVPVFNSPFCNSRSVAELIIAQIITLARQLGDRNMEMHRGEWNKTAKNCHEIRGKTLGIVGYGHIGSQLSVLAEAMGMHVIYYDVVKVLPLGNSRALSSLAAVLEAADFVSLHVPLSKETENLIGERELRQMRQGACLLNASRGTVVALPALAAALRSGHLAGAYIDVFPEEPAKNGKWRTELMNLPNVLLSPHIGGSTEEAQAAIADEVAEKLIQLINAGHTLGAVNFPQVALRPCVNSHRILNVHRNVPGVLRDLNKCLEGYNVLQQFLSTTAHVGYAVIDVNADVSHTIRDQIDALPNSIRTRILY